ncbi:MAG: Crp/Fnr family transcriptional regulator [Phycisphaeraceae bacterium]|nr:Crp/Fnr family transcriptional regulator [Phycisphaeraceae bacterium]
MSLEALKILARCHMFGRVSEAGMQELAAMAQVQKLSRGQIVFHQGDEPPGMFVVGSGTVRIYKIAPNGKEHVLHLAGPGLTFAEVAVMGNFPCPAFAQAIETSEVVLLPTAPFMKALKTNHELPLQLLTGMAFWVHHMVDTLEDIVLRDATGRLCRYLVDTHRDGVATLPKFKRHLASKLNLTSETLSRVLRRLLDEQLIEQGDSKELIRLLDIDTLQEMADGGYA